MSHRNLILCCTLVVFMAARSNDAAPPRVTSDRYQLELLASEPEIVTPIGMAFDRQGRLLVIESHTHQRPEGYDGPAKDRIRMLDDSDDDGRLDRWSTFAEGFRHAMNLLARDDGAIYCVERGRLLLLRDTDDDGKADKQDVLLRLETEDDYPHNALGGIDQTADGSLIIGLGENHGLAYRLIGSDGKEFAATGGVDGFFRCTADGANIEHVARGVWNPFSLCVLDDGRIFAVDNDPDASPPCRLLHVVEGGDYGYLYQYGRAGTHPLQAWNGELPGTLPMVCGVGEGPTAMVAHAGRLWVTSWGDHRIERYSLVPRGASYSATREVVVQGDADFRPTGMAVAPDGSLYFGDWVLRDYPVHRQGRIWRLVATDDETAGSFPEQVDVDKLAMENFYGGGPASRELGDPFARAFNVEQMSRKERIERWGTNVPLEIVPVTIRLAKLEALRWRGSNRREAILREALRDNAADVRLYAVRWIADERITALRDDVAKLLDSPQPSSRYYMALLAAVDWLDHEPSMRGREIADELLVRELRNDRRSPEAHMLALRLLSPDHKLLTLNRLREFLNTDHLALEAARSLAQQSNPDRFDLLAELAGDEARSENIRAEAIVGLAADAESQRELLDRLAASDQPILQREAERLLRIAGLRPALKEEKPPADDLARWNKLMKGPGDTEAGRRLFFNPVGGRCGVCHQHDGRGGRSGPDLTYIGRSTSRERIIASILQPDQEIAPHYQAWSLVTDDGKTHLGLKLPEGGDDGMEEYVDSAGRRFSLRSDAIESREAATTSIMPSGLEKTLSISDLRDLVAFLVSTQPGN
jgi:putative membrane-bound dehydrogenase-like protein